ncbi:MAG TPA: diacylglycerol kinase family protein [Thermoanaerobaculia bacterium]|nr:diacylglycerol kinase family protein [Thermoanaerobaculia bacterium]
MPARTCIILNPNAGSAGEVERLREALEKHPDTVVRVTEKEGDAREIAAAAVGDGAELVVAAGGDGTLNEVVNGLGKADFGTRLGLVPLGTGNDFARSINVPADLDAALAILETGRVQAVDVACATFAHQSRYFINVSAGGFSGVVSVKAGEAKDRWGPLAYLRAAVGTLPELQGFKTRITLNGGEVLDLETYNIVIANGRFVAAGIPVAPQAKLDDGLLDVMIAPAVTMPQLALLIPQVLMGRHTENDLLLFRKVTSIEIESDPPMSFNVDGELIGDEPARFVVLPRALEVIVGPEPEAG